MIARGVLTFFLFHLTCLSICNGQDNTFYKEKELEDGSIEVTIHDSNPVDLAVLSEQLGERKFNTASNPIAMTLNRLDLDQLKSLVGLELAQDQEEKIAAIISDFKAKTKGVEGLDKTKILMEFEGRLKDVFLPEQLESLSKFGKISRRVWPFVTKKEVADILEITPAQALSIKRECTGSAKSIDDAISQIQEITERERDRFKAILKNLDKKQRVRLQKIIGAKDLDVYFDKLNLVGLRAHVTFFEEE